eukprot:TRINITY_DN1296_c7_g1_i1.p1 TRINITY_DN1296_c7_g1~~TRINITY_DN1296_c7_g1_i1.p1  ORF type:complete len:138 (+),score=48.06 TRINITY_DN1296_c7_g1_i1:60-416(+)
MNTQSEPEPVAGVTPPPTTTTTPPTTTPPLTTTTPPPSTTTTTTTTTLTDGQYLKLAPFRLGHTVAGLRSGYYGYTHGTERGEPLYTNFQLDFRDCLDYVFLLVFDSCFNCSHEVAFG